MLHILKWKLFGRTWSVITRVERSKTEFHYGVTNRCQDGTRLLFLDYDDTPLEWVKDDVALLREWHTMGDAYLFKTKHGYHVICLEKRTTGDIIIMQGMTSCDDNYKHVALQTGRAKLWVLRQSEKNNEHIHYLGRLQGKTSRMMSLAHARYLVMHCGVPASDVFGRGKHYDTSTRLCFGTYKITKEDE